MSYQVQATQNTPALIIYLLDVSASMCMELGDRRRIDWMMECLNRTIRQMIFRSTRGSRIANRYRIAMLAYSDQVYDLFDGIKGIEEIASWGKLPDLDPMRFTDTAKAFRQVKRLLQQEIPFLHDHPAPLVCHITDGLSNGEDPIPIAKEIMDLSVPDGKVLIENIFIADGLLETPIKEVRQWGGIREDTPLKGKEANILRTMSSKLPDSYRLMMMEAGYQLDRDAYMMLPGMNLELVSLGFQMSAATPVR